MYVFAFAEFCIETEFRNIKIFSTSFFEIVFQEIAPWKSPGVQWASNCQWNLHQPPFPVLCWNNPHHIYVVKFAQRISWKKKLDHCWKLGIHRTRWAQIVDFMRKRTPNRQFAHLGSARPRRCVLQSSAPTLKSVPSFENIINQGIICLRLPLFQHTTYRQEY